MSIYWPDDNHYYDGTVLGLERNNKHDILYDDENRERTDLTSATWKRLTAVAASGEATRSVSLDANVIEQAVLQQMHDYLGNKPFKRHHWQGFEQYPIQID